MMLDDLTPPAGFGGHEDALRNEGVRKVKAMAETNLSPRQIAQC